MLVLWRVKFIVASSLLVLLGCTSLDIVNRLHSPLNSSSTQTSASCTPPSDFQKYPINYGKLNGHVYDQSGKPLSNATVILQFERIGNSFTSPTLESQYLPCQRQRKYTTTTDEQGAYFFKDIRRFAEITITAKKQGYINTKYELPRKNEKHNSEFNLLDYLKSEINFGIKGQTVTQENSHGALIDIPEVQFTSPSLFQSEVDSQTTFTLVFSEAMNVSSVEKNFIIRRFSQSQFTKPIQNPNETDNLNRTSRLEKLLQQLGKAPQSGEKIWDINAFHTEWNQDKSSLRLQFKDGYALPSANLFEATPVYYLSFTAQDGQIKDQKGIIRSENYFHVSSNYLGGINFKVALDQNAPEVVGIETHGEGLRVKFSETMVFNTLSSQIIGGQNGNLNQAPAASLEKQFLTNTISSKQAASNYSLKVFRNKVLIADIKQLFDLSWKAIFDNADSSNQSVLLLPPPHQDSLWQKGDLVRIEVAETVVDPAGNPIAEDKRTAEIIIGGNS